MNQQRQQLHLKSGHSASAPAPQKPDKGVFGLLGASWLVLCLILSVGAMAVGIYGWQRHRFESQKKIEAQRLIQVRENLDAIAFHLNRYELEQLKVVKKQLTVDFELIAEQLLIAHQEAKSPLFVGPTEKIERVITESMNKIDKQKKQLQELVADLARSEAALEGGREACMEHIWLLEAVSKGGCSIEVSSETDEISLENRICEELVLQRDQLVIERLFDSNHPLVLVFDREIEQHEAKIVALSEQSSKILDANPEVIIQRYIDDLKKKIGDLRDSLALELASYRENYRNAVDSEGPKAEVRRLLVERNRLAAELERVDGKIEERELISESKGQKLWPDS